MLDTDLIIADLKAHGHTVEAAFAVPTNAGDYEFIVDGNTLTLEEVRALLAHEQQ